MAANDPVLRRPSAPSILLDCGLFLLCLTLCSCALGGGAYTPIQTSFNRGVYHQSGGRYEQAIHEYRAALSEDPADHRARFNLALSLESWGEFCPETRRSALRESAAAEYELILDKRPDDLRASINLAAIEAEKGNLQDAKTRLRECISLHPRAILPRTALAAHLYREGELIQAEELLLEATALDGVSVDPWILLGDCLRDQGKYDPAHAAYEQALLTDSTDIGAFLSLAQLELARDQPLEAASWLRWLLLIDADHGTAHFLLANTLEDLGDLEGAIFHLWQARDLDPGNETRGAIDYQERLSSLYRRLLTGKIDAP